MQKYYISGKGMKQYERKLEKDLSQYIAKIKNMLKDENTSKAI
jgi:hypothetical protein